MYIEINLIPDSFYKAKKKKQFIFILLIGGVSIVLFFFVLYILKITEISHLNNEIAKTKAEQQKYVDTLNKIDAIKRDEDNLKERLKVLDTLLNNQAIWPKLLDDLNKVTPGNIWFRVITNKKEGSGKNFSIEGYAVSKSAVADFLYNLQRSNYFTNIILVSLLDNGKNAVDRVTFKIVCSSKI